MLEIKNTEVWGLERAITASGNPMIIGEIDTSSTMTTDQYYDGDETKDSKRAKKLGSAPVGSAHDHFLVGIHVQFDIKYPQYWTIEAERYHNFEIISSQSKMHRLTMMGKGDDFSSMFNKYVDEDIINRVLSYITLYNDLASGVEDERGGYSITYYDGVHNYFDTKQDWEQEKYNYFMKCVSNLPMGFEMWMTCDLTYLQIKTMYMQRKNHKLKEDWGAFCDWCESLPLFKELIGIQKV